MRLSLVVENIHKGYENNPVLKGCSFSFDQGGIYVIMGPNGSGKSTFLRISALLEDPDGGEVIYYFERGPVKNDIHLKRRITLVLPRIGVFNTTIAKNVAYGLNIRGFKKDEIEKEVIKALDFVGLLKRKDQNALTLSSGETQRLGIARALAIEPDMIFLDEPTASVDQKNTEIIEEIIMNVKREGRSTIIMATHDVAQCERLADRMLLIRDGKIQEKNERNEGNLDSGGRIYERS